VNHNTAIILITTTIIKTDN